MADDQSSDFFRYGRGYALYSQGMTDVGKLLVDNAGDDTERIHAAIERDTLLLAKAAGQGLTLDEYKQIHNQVQGLYQQYLKGQINNATYQERLWSLPQLARSDRGKKSPHYTPTRDKAGNPVAGKPGANLVPPETMAKLAPGMANVPPPKLQDLLRPPGDGDVPHMAGAPPVARQALAGGVAGAPPPISEGRRSQGGFLDQIQAGLDAVGIIEPTPFADGTNAAISAVRALMDPQHAGEHLRNAGVSLASMIPYVGDAAKLVKYGGKATAGASRAGGGRGLARAFGSIVGAGANMAGASGGGGGSGGGDGGAGPAPGAGGDPAHDELAGMIDAVAGRFGNLAKAMGPVGFALAGVVVGLRAFIGWLGQVDAKSRKMIEDNRGLAQFSGSLAGSYATLDNERLLREINKAQELSGPLGRLTKNQSGFEAAKEDLFLPFQKLLVDVQAFSTQVATYAVQIIDYLEPISEILEAWYGEEKDKGAANNVVDFLAREANERMAKRKL